VNVREALLHPWLTVRLQILLGVIFIAAALPKIVDPPSFLHMISNYKLIPASLVPAMALIMPWIELLTGVALVLGVWRRTATLFIGAMLLAFIVAISVNIARDNAVNCGCFSVADQGKPHDVLMSEMKMVVLRDVGMLLIVAQLIAAERRLRGSLVVGSSL
jgi:uncharacterized membrane protein YphA (DoxX/SURF4 family)